MSNNSEISVVILAAGFSSRMKQAKFSLMFDRQQTFLEKIVQEYLTFGCKEIIVVMNSDGIKLKNTLQISFPEQVLFVLNKHPEKERFYSLQTGLKAISHSDYTFIQNSDNPFVNQEVLYTLFSQKDKADYIVPTYKNKGGHPILLNKYIINEISSEKNDSNLKKYLKRFTKKQIPVNDENILLNINDREKYYSIFNSIIK